MRCGPSSSFDTRDKLESATPHDTGKRGAVPKRRFQKGCFWLKNGMAYTFYYEDQKQPDGSLVTRKVRHFIGRVPEQMSKRAAEEEHARIMQAVHRERGSVAPAVKGSAFKDAVESWRKDDAPDLSPSTLRQRESHLRQHILPRFANEAPHTLNVPRLKKFSRELRESGLSRKTVVQVLATIFGILVHAEKNGIAVSKVSLKELKLGREKKSSAPFFSREEALQIISAASEPYHTLFSVAFFTGCRAGEILGLQVRDLDFTRREISIQRTVDDNTREIREVLKTDESIAPLPMPSVLAATLQTYLKTFWRSNPDGFLFPNPNGKKPRRRDNVVRYGLKPLLRRLGIPTKDTGLHAFRHALATTLVESGVALPIVAKQMRHSDVTTTLKIYSQAIPETHRDVMEKLGQQSVCTDSISTECRLVQKNFVN